MMNQVLLDYVASAFPSLQTLWLAGQEYQAISSIKLWYQHPSLLHPVMQVFVISLIAQSS